MSQSNHAHARQLMIEQQLKSNGIDNQQMLRAFAEVPRHQFLRRRYQSFAYRNQMVSIGHGQSMLSPVMLAQAIQALKLTSFDKVLEIGTGSGYSTTILMMLSRYVFSLERIPHLADAAAYRWQDLGLHNVDLHIGDGSQGLADMAHYDAILVTAYVNKIPKPLALQLHPLRGRMVIPVGNAYKQKLKLIRREADQWRVRTITTINGLAGMVGRYGATPPSAFV